MKWNDFPDDIIKVISYFLTRTEVQALVYALLDTPYLFPEQIPISLRRTWIQSKVLESFKNFVYDELADKILYETREPFTSTVILLDWSCFSAKKPFPVSEIMWMKRRACVHFYDTRLLDELEEHAAMGLTVVRVTIHRSIIWKDTKIVNPEPTSATTHRLIPDHLLNAFKKM